MERLRASSADPASTSSQRYPRLSDELVHVLGQPPVRDRELRRIPVGVNGAVGVEQTGQQVAPLRLARAQIRRRDVLVAEHAERAQQRRDGAVVVVARLAAAAETGRSASPAVGARLAPVTATRPSALARSSRAGRGRRSARHHARRPTSQAPATAPRTSAVVIAQLGQVRAARRARPRARRAPREWPSRPALGGRRAASAPIASAVATCDSPSVGGRTAASPRSARSCGPRSRGLRAARRAARVSVNHWCWASATITEPSENSTS